MKNANQIRQLLMRIFKIADIDEADERQGYPLIKNLASETLALLPCETCNGTGKKPKKVHCKLHQCIKSHDGITCSPHGKVCEYYIPSDPCPDCQPKKIPNINPAETISEYPESMKKPPREESSPSMMWEHLH